MKSIATLFFIILSICGKAQLNIQFDFTNAIATIDFLKKTNPSTAGIKTMVASDGVQTIIKKIHSTDSIAAIALYKAANSIKATGKESDFQYDFIKAHLSEMENFLLQIKSNNKIILDSIQSLARYLPAGKTAAIKVCFLMGGFSAGFTMGDDNIFYIGTHQYKYDMTGIVNTCQHELFHNIQSLLYTRTKMMQQLQNAKEDASLFAYYLFVNLFVEGSAEYVADIDKMDTASSYIKRQVEHASVNNYRMADNFFLIETIIMSAFKNPGNTDADAAYHILFDWNWNNPGYVTGKLMCKALVKAYGPGIIQKYLAADPVTFIKDYIQLARANNTVYPYNFSAEFEQMIDTVSAKVVALQNTD